MCVIQFPRSAVSPDSSGVMSSKLQDEVDEVAYICLEIF